MKHTIANNNFNKRDTYKYGDFDIPYIIQTNFSRHGSQINQYDVKYYKLYNILEIAKMSLGLCSVISIAFPHQMRKMQFKHGGKKCWYITLVGLNKLITADYSNVNNLKPIIQFLQSINSNLNNEPKIDSVEIAENIVEDVNENEVIVDDIPPEIIIADEVVPELDSNESEDAPVIQIPSIISKLDVEIEMYKQVISILENAKMQIRELKKSL